jgi:ABC-type transport system involved in multi-copper enzyme maturation permease subunit
MLKTMIKRVRREKVSIIFRKELRAILTNKQIILTLIIPPLVFSLLVPLSLIPLTFTDFSSITNSLELPSFVQNIVPYWNNCNDLQKIALIQANLFMPFLVVIPMFFPVVLAGDSLAGEKERKTIEGLLAAPISEEELLLGKGFAITIPILTLSVLSFLIYAILTDIILFKLMNGIVILPNAFSLILFFIVMPTITILSIIISLNISSKATGSREAIQKGGLITMPAMIIVSILIFVPVLFHLSLYIASEMLLLITIFLLIQQTANNLDREKILG